MRTISVTKATPVGGTTYRGGTHIVSDEVAKALLASGNATEKTRSTPVNEAVAVDTIAPDYYGPTGVNHREKPAPKTTRAKKEAE